MTFNVIERRRIPGAGALRVSMALGVVGWLAAAGLQAEECWREPVTADWQLAEFSFVTWGDTGESRAVLVDMLDEKAQELVMDRDRVPGTVVPRPGPSVRAGDFFPEPMIAKNGEPIEQLLYGIKRSNGGFVGLNLNKGNSIPSAINWYDASLGERGRTGLLSQVTSAVELMQDNRVLSLWDWQPVADQFFAYGALGIAGKLNVVREGFYITQLRTPGNKNVTPMARMVWDLPGHRHYTFHHELIAVDGDVVYFLEMGTHPRLMYYDVRNDVQGRRLVGFPGSEESIAYPPLTTIDGMYKELEEMSIPVGLYASGGYLFALLRQPVEGAKSGVTSWTVVRLLPDIDNRIVTKKGEIRLPTQRAARHLYVLPGEPTSTWLVLELDSMPPRLGKHRLLAAVTIPHDWITEPDKSPLEAKRRAQVVCQSGT